MRSSPSEPFLFIIRGEIPALKNEHAFRGLRTNGSPIIGSSKKILNWYAEQEALLLPQLLVQKHLDPVLAPDRAYVRFEIFAEDALGPTDLDNAFTTCLEMLQPNTVNKGFLGVLHNDSHVQAYSAVQLPLQPNTGPMAYLWMWQWMEGDDISQLMLFDSTREYHLAQRLKKKTIADRFFD